MPVSNGFHELSQRAQAVRVARLARAAVGAYIAEPVRVEPLYFGMNTVFRVVATETGTRFVLRVHPAKWLRQAQVEAEMQWLHALSGEARLPVPSPVRRLDGYGFTTLAGGAEVGGARCCTLCRWMEGRTMSARLTAQQMHRSGELLARIHEHGRAHAASSPRLFDRPRLDCDGIFGPGGIFDPRGGLSKLTEAHMAVVTPALRKVGEAMDALGEGPETFGPIHGDFYFRNILVMQGSIGVIDFDMSGWGHYCFDLAIPHWPSEIWRRGPDHLASILTGYRSLREFPEAQERHLPAMLAARRLMDVYCVISRWEHPDMRAAFPESVDWACSLLRKWLDTGEMV